MSGAHGIDEQAAFRRQRVTEFHNRFDRAALECKTDLHWFQACAGISDDAKWNYKAARWQKILLSKVFLAAEDYKGLFLLPIALGAVPDEVRLMFEQIDELQNEWRLICGLRIALTTAAEPAEPPASPADPEPVAPPADPEPLDVKPPWKSDDKLMPRMHALVSSGVSRRMAAADVASQARQGNSLQATIDRLRRLYSARHPAS